MAIKKIIAIGSAKGGVGKSSMTASLAISLSKNNKVGILDADIYGPNQHLLFNTDTKPKFEDKSIIPISKQGIQIISIGNILNSEEAAIWRGPMLSGAIKKLIHSTKWDDLDYLLIDMPPGTGDAYLTIFNELNVDHFILVTTENRLALSDLKKTITMLNKLNINILGYIRNNILNMQDKFDDTFFKSNDITHLGTFLFDKKIYNFDCEYNSDVSNEISKIIYIKTK
jgi:ATP-binding protein involved in chromosome partitioning